MYVANEGRGIVHFSYSSTQRFLTNKDKVIFCIFIISCLVSFQFYTMCFILYIVIYLLKYTSEKPDA